MRVHTREHTDHFISDAHGENKRKHKANKKQDNNTHPQWGIAAQQALSAECCLLPGSIVSGYCGPLRKVESIGAKCEWGEEVAKWRYHLTCQAMVTSLIM